MSLNDEDMNTHVNPPAKHYEIGKSMPMNMDLPTWCVVGVSETTGGLKFVHISSKRLYGKYLLILFMDNKLTDPEINEWLEFSSHKDKFKYETSIFKS